MDLEKTEVIVIVLGRKIAESGELNPKIGERIKKGFQVFKERKQGGKTVKISIISHSFQSSFPKTLSIKKVVSGKGVEKISESKAMKNWLILNGVEEKEIVEEAESMNTVENGHFCMKFLENWSLREKNLLEEIIVVSSDHHIVRAKSVFVSLFFEYRRFLPEKTVLRFEPCESQKEEGIPLEREYELENNGRVFFVCAEGFVEDLEGKELAKPAKIEKLVERTPFNTPTSFFIPKGRGECTFEYLKNQKKVYWMDADEQDSPEWREKCDPHLGEHASRKISSQLCQKLSEGGVELILCSPLTRSLEFARKIVSHFGNLGLEIQVIVVPFLRESLKFPCDVGSNLEKISSEFSFDFSLVPKFWWFESFRNNSAHKVAQEKKVSSESQISVNCRASNAAYFLSFILKEKKLLVISHKNFLSNLLGKGFSTTSPLHLSFEGKLIPIEC